MIVIDTIELDYSLSTAEERVEYVKQLLKKMSNPNNNQLTILADYILFVKDRNQTKAERQQEHPILTPNREFTIDKRQTSYEGLVEKLDNGEDGIYNLMSNNKNQRLDAKEPITQKDVDTIPGLKDCMTVIDSLKSQYEKATGKRRKSLHNAIVETWKQAYLIKGTHKIGLGPHSSSKIATIADINIPEEVWFDDNMIPHSDKPLSLLNPEHISFLLQYYQTLKQETWEMLHCDMRWHLIDLEDITTRALEHKYPLLYDIVIWKIDGLTNAQIREQARNIYGEDHSEQYYSTIWRKRIPKLIAEEAQKHYLLWFCRHKNIGYWKRCSKCGRIKLGHTLFFAKNSSKDGFYSQCKDCKNKSRLLKKGGNK